MKKLEPVNRTYPIYDQLAAYYDFCEQILGFTPKTMSIKTHAINDFIRFSGLKRLEDVTNQQIYDWVSYHKNRGNSGRSVNNYLHQLKAMLKWHRDENTEMPGLKLSRIAFQREAPARKNWFTRDQINLALLYADQRERLMITLAFECGMRIEELVGLQVSDISGRKVKIIGKGNKLRWGMMSRKTAREVRNWIRHHSCEKYLWEGVRRGSHLTQDNARKIMQHVFARAGFTNFRPHDLRHSFATDLKLLGLSTREIQLALGHTSEAITEHYLSDLDGVTIEALHKKAGSALRWKKIKNFWLTLEKALPRITLKSVD